MLKTKIFFVKKNNFASLPSYSKTFRQIFNKNNYLSLNTSKQIPNTNFGVIKFDLLNIFYTVVVYGSITTASKQLSMTQPSTSLCLQKLETDIGCVLFDKSSNIKGIKLTPSGLLLFNYIQRLFDVIFESCCLVNYLNRQNFTTTYFRLGQIKSITKNQHLLLNINKTYSIYSNFHHFSYKNSSRFISSLLISVSKSYKLYENRKRILILEKKCFLTKSNLFCSSLDTPLQSKTFEWNKLQEFSNPNKTLFSSIVQNQFIEVETTKAFQTCIDLKVFEIFCWGAEI